MKRALSSEASKRSITSGDCRISASRKCPETKLHGAKCGPNECNRRTRRGWAAAGPRTNSNRIAANRTLLTHLIPRQSWCKYRSTRAESIGKTRRWKIRTNPLVRVLWGLGHGRMVSSWAHFIPRKTDTECLPCTRDRKPPPPSTNSAREFYVHHGGPHIGVYTEVAQPCGGRPSLPCPSTEFRSVDLPQGR